MNKERVELDTLQKAGLTESQAKSYLTLIENGALTPTKLAEITGETRTNSYSIVERLEKLGLIEKTKTRKATYSALHPSNLEVLVEKRRKLIQRNEQIVKQGVGSLIDIFYAHNEIPGSRTLVGIDGIKEIYMNALVVKKDVYLLRSPADIALGKEFWHEYRNQLPKLGIHTYALTQDTDIARINMKSGRDKEINFHRTLMPADAYTTPVAIQVFGNKLAFIAFGETQMSTIIDSQPIAEAMRQILQTMTKYYAENYPQDPDLKQTLFDKDDVY